MRVEVHIMANNELAIRFTETKYATRSEVSRELKMSLIDNIWSNILNYRSTFNHYLMIKSIEKNSLVICQCPSVASLCNATDMKLLNLMKEHSRLNPNTGELAYFEDQCLILSLKALAKEYDLDVTDAYLRSLIHGEVREINKENRILINYLSALQYVKKAYMNPIDIDMLAGIYSRVTGTEEITSFYRTQEDRDHGNRVIIDRVYTCAPTSLIEGMVNNLFAFINNSTLNATSKAAIAYYYLVYIRPFDVFSDEIALLTAKAIIAHNDVGEVGALLPLESLLSQDQEEIAKIFVEVQKSNDTTYFVNYMLRFITNKCDDLLDIIVNSKATSMRNDFYRMEPEKQAIVPPEEPVIKEETTSFVSEETPKQFEQPTLFEQPKVEQPAPAVFERPVETAPIRQEIKVEPAPEVKVEPKIKAVENEQIAVSYIPPVLDEKQASRLEQHLLELDPSLRKHEAHFYARHCTLGKNYTISQYKKSIGCVYETARTSMDHLVELGYYRKEMVKNKNVYSPIARKD